jgi:hypothetical protein
MGEIRQAVTGSNQPARDLRCSPWVEIRQIIEDPRNLAQRRWRPDNSHPSDSRGWDFLASAEPRQPLTDAFMRDALPGLNFGLRLGVKTRFLRFVQRGIEDRFCISSHKHLPTAPTIAQFRAARSSGKHESRNAAPGDEP